MRYFKQCCLILSLLIMLSSVVCAADYVRLRNGSRIDGELLELGKDSIRFRDKSTGSVFEFGFSEINPRDVYRFRNAVIDKSDEAAMLDLAQFCLQEGLVKQGKRILEVARRLRGEKQDEIEAMFLKFRKLEAEAKLDDAVKLFEQQDYLAVIKLCKKIMRKYSDTDIVDKARSLSNDAVAAQDLAAEVEAQKKAEEELRAKQDTIAKELKRLDDLLAKVLKNVNDAKALRNEGLEADTKGQWTKALKAFEKAEKFYAENETILMSKFIQVRFLREDYRHKAENALKKNRRWAIDCLVAHAYVYIHATNWKQARRMVIKALLLDANHTDAKEAMKLISENYISRSVKEIQDGATGQK